MSKIRKLSLDEWFLRLQLKKLNKSLHLPAFIKVDISHLVESSGLASEKFLYTPLLIKAAGILLYEKPEINRVHFNTLFGHKVVELDYIAVNIPLIMELEGKKILTAHSLHEPHKKSLFEIKEEIKLVFKKTWKELPINNIIHNGSNNFLNRIKLFLIHFCAHRFPSFYIKNKAGGISVSSMLNLKIDRGDVDIVAYGQTIYTLCSCFVSTKNKKTILNIGMGFEHMSCHGQVSAETYAHLAKILESEKYKEQLLGPPIRSEVLNASK